ncbi:MAG TPA: AraC family transcriptional regulator, partial [Cellvibrionaceae bacterium]
MLEFYRKALLALLGLLLVSTLAAYWCLERTFLHLTLLPSASSDIPWQAAIDTDASQGGESSVKVFDDSYSLDFELFVSSTAEYPHAAVELMFRNNDGEPTLIDLSLYDSLTFTIKCSPANVLAFTAFTFDEQITQPGNFLTYRS